MFSHGAHEAKLREPFRTLNALDEMLDQIEIPLPDPVPSASPSQPAQQDAPTEAQPKRVNFLETPAIVDEVDETEVEPEAESQSNSGETEPGAGEATQEETDIPGVPSGAFNETFETV